MMINTVKTMLFRIPRLPKSSLAIRGASNLSYEEILKTKHEHMSPVVDLYYKEPLLITHGEKQFLFGHDGRRYLDLLAGIVTVSVGYNHPRVNEAAKQQMDRIWHTTTCFLNKPTYEYITKLKGKMTGALNNFFFTNSGSESNDLALTLARMYTGNMDIIALRNSYHGITHSLNGIMNMGSWRKMNCPGFGTHAAVNPDPYRGPWGGAHCRDSPVQTDRKCSCSPNACEACEKYVGQLSDLLTYGVPKAGVAAIIIESIQGAGGTVQFPKGFVKKAFELVRSRGGICISDEVQTGFGRTGEHFWGYEMHGVQPDIVIMAKGIANGFPMSALVTTKEIAKSLTQSSHFNTFGGNPLACSVASAVLDVIDDEKLQKNSLDVGTYFLVQLEKLKEKHSVIGDVRGKGLMIGIELVKDKASKAPLEREKVNELLDIIKEHGVILGKGGPFGSVLRIKPPMCLNKGDVDFAMDVFEKSLKKLSV